MREGGLNGKGAKDGPFPVWHRVGVNGWPLREVTCGRKEVIGLLGRWCS